MINIITEKSSSHIFLPKALSKKQNVSLPPQILWVIRFEWIFHQERSQIIIILPPERTPQAKGVNTFQLVVVYILASRYAKDGKILNRIDLKGY